MKNKFFFATIVLLLYIEVSPAKAQALFDIETGIFFTGYNDVRIPGDKGTLFSLKNDLKPKNKSILSFASKLHHKIAPHNIRVICASRN